MSGDAGVFVREDPAAAALDGAWLRPLVREIPDFPEPGVLFRDITPLLAHADTFRRCVDELIDRFASHEVDTVVGIEARGFILAAPIAYLTGASFVPVRKAGKLPWAVAREEYVLEYRSEKLELHRDAIRPGERVLVIDDVLATGGTAAATCRLIETLGGNIVGLGVLIELTALGGRAALGDRLVESLVRFD
ncbi:MAG: adenine phosphoribosyltransferase [Ilumatobacteraceae bacterium]